MKIDPSSNAMHLIYKSRTMEDFSSSIDQINQFLSLPSHRCSLNLKSEPSHATPILLNNRLAVVGLRVIRFREQHAVVASGFLFFADAAGLFVCTVVISIELSP
jgi:hypothetical protein